MLLSIDAGTTHCKAGLFEIDGSTISVATLPSPLVVVGGTTEMQPDALWHTVSGVVSKVMRQAREHVGGTLSVDGIGIASMAETGLLLRRRDGVALTPFLPWFDNRSRDQTMELRKLRAAETQFRSTGVHLLPKHGMTKLRWLLETGIVNAGESVVWLSVADYIAFRMTNRLVTDPTLAARTGAFDIDTLSWDANWLRTCGISIEWFPELVRTGEAIGEVGASVVDDLGVPAGVPVTIAGHDHLCALFAFASVNPDCVLDSMGTAETLVGCMSARALTSSDYKSGLVFGNHVDGTHRFWLGSLPSSGGATEWFRTQMCQPALSYQAFIALLNEQSHEPTGILYLPHIDSASFGPSGVFAGLKHSHTRGQLARAVLEGTAYAMEHIRRQAQIALTTPIEEVIAVGGGTRNPVWLQIKADVSGIRINIPQVEEATLLGAAIVAGRGVGVYTSQPDVVRALRRPKTIEVHPNDSRHQRYLELYAERYKPLYTSLVS